uniref:Calmodulin-lysine N-methyltransferase n=1 Tax=Haptolina ericina TaxID=156174 RepID=A0A7S3BA56_9EUKA|mmetsp:Transcript_55052/g.123082  ORF Transcript_55052/g.123082 Transcript_55052/m.123082 type:complete len:155 (+) Transcript_55052:2-466(+)
MGELGTVVELGSGTGLCGMACAALGAKRVLLTDLAEALPLLQRNASASQWTSQLEVHTLKWGETLPSGCEPFGLVVACDCLYRPEDYPAFAATVAALGAPALIAWRQRQRSEDAILGMLAAHGFAVSEERSRVVDDSQVRLVRAVPLGYSRRKR